VGAASAHARPAAATPAAAAPFSRNRRREIRIRHRL
jgi:hypothetical protein